MSRLVQQSLDSLAEVTRQGDLDEAGAQKILARLVGITDGRSFNIRRLRKQAQALAGPIIQKDSATSFGTIAAVLNIHGSLSDRAIAPTHALTGLRWVNLVLSNTAPDATHVDQVIASQAALLDLCAISQQRSSVANASRRLCRKLICQLLRGQHRQGYFDRYCALLLKPQTASIWACLLGIFLECAAANQSYKTALIDRHEAISSYFAQALIADKTPCPIGRLDGFGFYLQMLAPLADITDVFIPAVTRGLLRSPEAVCSPLGECFVRRARPDDDDCSVIIVDKLSPAFANLFKSSNASTRDAAARAACSLFARPGGKNRDRLCSNLIDIYSKERPSVEQRIAILRVLKHSRVLSTDQQWALITFLLAQVGKEGNESVQIELIAALLNFINSEFAGDALPDGVLAAVSKGLKEKKAALKNAWCSDRLLGLTQRYAASKATEDLISQIWSTWCEDSKSFQQVLSNGIFSSWALMLRVLVSDVKLNAAMTTDLQTRLADDGFLLYTEKSIGRLTLDEADIATHAIFEATRLLDSSHAVRCAKPWACGVMNLVARSPKTLSQIKSWSHASLLAPALVEVLRERLAAADDPPSLRADLVNAVAGILASVGNSQTGLADETLDKLLLDALVPFHDPACGDEQIWVKTSQALGRDPAELIQSRGSEPFDLAHSSIRFTTRRQPGATAIAASRAVATILLVCPDQAVPLVQAAAVDDLSTELDSIDETQIAIWLTPPGQAFVNVNAPEKAIKLDKNTRDWKTRQWEDDVKAAVAAKKGPSRALSKEQQAKLDAQLATEAEIRSSVDEKVSRLRRGLALLNALNQPFVVDSAWVGPTLTALAGSARAATALCGDEVRAAFLSFSSRAPDRSDVAQQILHTLASLNRSGEDSARESITSTLYKMRFETERQVFDAPLAVIGLALITEVVRNDGIACRQEEQRSEQLELALAWLEANIEVLAGAAIDRAALFVHLGGLLHRRTSLNEEVKDTLQPLCSHIGDTATLEELRSYCQHFCHDSSVVRGVFLQCADTLDIVDLEFSLPLYLAMFDDVDTSADTARSLWTTNALKAPDNLAQVLTSSIRSSAAFERRTAAEGLADLAKCEEDHMPVMDVLKALYIEDVKPPPTKVDQFGQVIASSVRATTGTGEVRQAVLYCLRCLTTKLAGDELKWTAEFLFDQTLAAAPVAADPSDLVRGEASKLGLAIVQAGGGIVEALLPIFGDGVQHKGNDDVDHWIREAAVVLYGAAGGKLPAGDKRIDSVVETLLKATATPAETVQIAIADCLPSLISRTPAKHEDYFDRMMLQLTTDGKYAARRGAAFALAGLVQGTGLASFSVFKILDRLEESQANRQAANVRQGTMLALECLAQVLGPLFEPFAIRIVPMLLNAFADPSADVRNATQDAARAFMTMLSGYGVSLILPVLLKGLNDSAWRSKKGSVELLGAMAYCSPRQLAVSLPIIIPRLTEVLTDSHAQVRGAATQSLKRFGEVINNPEIQGLVDVLLKALEDPNKNTEAALDAVLKTSFLHYIDSPSLALLVPIVARGMGERSATTKRKSAKIFGLLSSLTDPNDLVPHIATLLPGLRAVLSDPVPEVRATAAKALGSLVEKLGERNFPTIVDELLDTLNADVSSTDRQGAAQAIAEVLSGLGLERLEDTLPRILKDSRSRLEYVREGFISLLIYLPATFGPRFAPYLTKAIAPVLAGLADETEFVREASLRAGKILIANYASKSVDLMLPELERGVFNDQWRIRLSSMQLVGELLFKVSGISNKVSADDEEDDDAPVATETQRKALLEALGQVRRDRVLCLIYILRFDIFALVRSSAVNIWKALVSNTPKMLKEILPAMLSIIIENLAAETPEKRAVFIEALGDLMKKLGQDLMTQLLPALQNGLESNDPRYRVGVSVAISELIQNASPEQLESSETELIKTLRSSLIDSDQQVRQAANVAFDALQLKLGNRIIDQVLPELLSLLQNETSSAAALEALKGMMQHRANAILPVLLPTLTKRPMTAFNLKALSSLSRVAGSALIKRLPSLLGLVLDAEIRNEAAEEASAAYETILLSVPEGGEGTAAAMNIIVEFIKLDDYRKRAAACRHCVAFFASTKIDFTRYTQDLMRNFVNLFVDNSPEVVQAAWSAQDALVKSLRKEDMERLVTPLRKSILHIANDDRDVPAFSLPKGLTAVLPIFLQGLLYGSSDVRQEAAEALGDVVRRTKADSLKVFVTQITGPLIRVVGERATSDVKAAILTSLHSLLEKIPLAVKPFLPQLQRTFTKSLADPVEAVRSKAARALGTLIGLGGRVDPLVIELIQGAQNAADDKIAVAMLNALLEITRKAGAAMSPVSKTNVLGLVRSQAAIALSSGGALDAAGKAAAETFGALVAELEDDQARTSLAELALPTDPSAFSCVALNACLATSANKFATLGMKQELADYLARHMLAVTPAVSESQVIAAGKFLLRPEFNRNQALVERIFEALSVSAHKPPSTSTECKRLALLVIKAFAARHPDVVRPQLLPTIAPAILPNLRDPVLPVKLAAEAAYCSVFDVLSADEGAPSKAVESYVRHCAKDLGRPDEAKAWVEYVKKYGARVAQAERDRVDSRDYDPDDDIEEIMGIEQGTTFDV